MGVHGGGISNKIRKHETDEVSLCVEALQYAGGNHGGGIGVVPMVLSL